MKTLQSIFTILLIVSTIAFAHGDEKHDEDKKDTVTVVNGDTIAVNGVPVDSLAKEEQTAVEKADTTTGAGKEQGKFELDFIHGLTEHIHNKIIHFPIALLVVAFILTLIGWKDGKFNTTIMILVFIAGLFAIAAYFTGTAQEEAFEGTPQEWLVEQHETFGIITLISTWIWFVFLAVKSIRKYAWIIGLIVFVIVSLTGFYGGVLAH